MSPRLAVQPLHPDHRHIPCPPALAPWIPPLHWSRTALLTDPGYRPAVADPPRVRVEIPIPPPRSRFHDRRCEDCLKSFTPKSGNQARCPSCGVLHRKASHTRKVGPRSARWERAMATRKINAATRHRAKSGQRKQAA